ncbi:MAG: HAD family phosphatase [Ignavibacterium sp.]|nr:MAG: HAD family phosphatase [Ignavibacterium sp.]
MRKRNISVIVFDLGNVLLPFDYNKLLSKLEKIESGLGEHFEEVYYSNYEFHRDFERGKISEEKFIGRMLKILNHKIDSDTFCNYYANIFEVNEDVAGLLPKLKDNYKLIMLSNTDPIHTKHGWEHYDFLQHFDKLILSHEAGAVKPEEEIYRAVETASGVPSEEHIFIDDIEKYVDAAKNLGWDGIHFTDYSTLIDDLNSRNIIT